MRRLYFYVHTHWDREWYQPFESFRAQLVPLVEKALAGLGDKSLPRFYLDGQSIIFDDVVRIVPELKKSLERWMQDGALEAGPWYVLCDQLLVGGESLIRNLKYGLKNTARFGNPAKIGYCPDTFGHSADLPRLLRGFDIDTAVVWRGAPLLQNGPLFWWSSPDGSRVLTYHLTYGYFQTFLHEAIAKSGGSGGKTPVATDDVLRQIKRFVESNAASRVTSYCAAIDGALLPIGGDHIGPPPKLAEAVAEINKKLASENADLELVPIGFGDFLSRVLAKVESSSAITTVDGELRSNDTAPDYERSYLLYGVLSTRLYLKRANRLSEYRLFRQVEPLATLLDAFGFNNYPHGELDHCLRLLLENHPHDSICGCSVDSVHREMLTRDARLNDALDGLLQQAAATVAGNSEQNMLSSLDPDYCADRLAVFNMTGSTVSAPVLMRWTLPEGAKAPASNNNMQIVSCESVDKLFCGWGTIPYYRNVELITAWVYADSVPSLGFKTLKWPISESSLSIQDPLVSAGDRILENGYLRLEVLPDGGLHVTQNGDGQAPSVFNLGHKIRDIGDGGDSYNFDPLPDDNPVLAKLVSVKPGASGPLVGSLILEYEIDIPASAEAIGNLSMDNDSAASKIVLLKRSERRIKHKLQTEITLKRGIPLVFFETVWNNQSSDHRLEVVFDTGSSVNETYSENHFSLIQRNHETDVLPEELPIKIACEARPDRYPCQRFFIANEQVFLNSGMPEYGVESGSVSMTMLRSISWLSKPRLWTRGGGAGPNVPVPEANCHGLNVCSYAWGPLIPAEEPHQAGKVHDEKFARAYALAEMYEGPLWSALTKEHVAGRNLAVGSVDSGVSLFAVSNSAIRLMSTSIDSDGRGIELRLLNCLPTQEIGVVNCGNSLSLSAVETNLAGAATESKATATSKSGSVQLTLSFGPFELKTLKLSCY